MTSCSCFSGSGSGSGCWRYGRKMGVGVLDGDEHRHRVLECDEVEILGCDRKKGFERV